MRALLFAVFVVPFCTSVVQGDLILQINTTDKTFAFTGSATGTPFNPAPDVGQTQWLLTGLFGTANAPPSVSYDNDMAFSTNVGTPGAFGFDTKLFVGQTGPITFALRIEFRTTSPATQTWTGSGVFQSYASLGTGSQAMLESAIGESAPLLPGIGSGFGGISIEAASTSSAVPEPSSFVLLSLSVAGFSLLHRRRKQKKLLEAETSPENA